MRPTYGHEVGVEDGIGADAVARVRLVKDDAKGCGWCRSTECEKILALKSLSECEDFLHSDERFSLIYEAYIRSFLYITTSHRIVSELNVIGSRTMRW